MTTTELKTDLHALIDKTNNVNLLNVIHAIISKFAGSKNADIVLSASEKKAVDEALKSVKNGNTHSHEKVMARMGKKYPLV